MKDKDAQRLLRQLMREYGYRDLDEMIEAALADSMCPGVCPTCGYSTEIERSRDAAWCDDCKTNTVISCLDLAESTRDDKR